MFQFLRKPVGLPFALLCLIQLVGPRHLGATTVYTSGPSASNTFSATYTHDIFNCQGTSTVQGPCQQSITPSASSAISFTLPDLTITPLAPNSVISAAYLSYAYSRTSFSDIVNFCGPRGFSCVYPQGASFFTIFTSVTFNGVTYNTGSNAVDLVALGLANDLVNGGVISATIQATFYFYTLTSWNGFSGAFAYQTRTVTQVNNGRLSLMTTFTEPPPGIPEPSTIVSAAVPLLFLAWRLRQGAASRN